MNSVKIILSISLLLCIGYTSSAQNEYSYYEETTIKSKISGLIKNGFIFQTHSGNMYEVSDYVYLYHYLYGPKVIVLKRNNSYKLIIEGIDQALVCKKLNESNSTSTSDKGVVESRIDGEFQGFDGDKIFKLLNGQIWQQSQYYYYYTYKYMPEVLIYWTSSGYMMKVDGVDRAVGVTRLK